MTDEHIIKEGAREHVTIYSNDGAHCHDCDQAAITLRNLTKGEGDGKRSD